MKLLFVVDGSFGIESRGLVLTPGCSPALPEGTPLFLVRPDGTHVTAVVRPSASFVSGPGARGAPSPILVDLLDGEAPKGTRVFGRDPTDPHPDPLPKGEGDIH